MACAFVNLAMSKMGSVVQLDVTKTKRIVFLRLLLYHLIRFLKYTSTKIVPPMQIAKLQIRLALLANVFALIPLNVDFYVMAINVFHQV